MRAIRYNISVCAICSVVSISNCQHMVTLLRDEGERKLTTNAYSRPSIKRQESPSWSQSLPSFWYEFFGFVPKNSLISVQGIYIVHDRSAFRDKQRTRSILTTTMREICVSHCLSGIGRNYRMESQCYLIVSIVYIRVKEVSHILAYTIASIPSDVVAPPSDTPSQRY